METGVSSFRYFADFDFPPDVVPAFRRIEAEWNGRNGSLHSATACGVQWCRLGTRGGRQIPKRNGSRWLVILEGASYLEERAADRVFDLTVTN